MKTILKIFSFLATLVFLEGICGKRSKKYSCRKIENTLPVVFRSTPITSSLEQYSWFSQNKAVLLGGVFIFLILGFLQSSLIKHSSFLKSSTFDLDRIVFEGAEFPVKKVPNWVALSDAERKMRYDQLPSHKIVDIPEYNPIDFQVGKTWKPNNERQRNAYITYPVPNLGNYRLDGREGAGSHPGIDIKVPIGTPIHAFANGIVTKVEYQKTGFGKFILIAHPKFPDPKDTRKKIMIYSVYAHLSEQLVREGDTVKKGQIIAKSGNTGMTTAPHLHFQIEHEDAPFHPYWPFTWKDLQAAGISSYFGAVNQGFNRSKAARYTLHPIHLKSSSNQYFASLKEKKTITASKEVEIKKEEVSQKEKITSSSKENTQSKPTLVADASSQEKKTLSETKIIPKRLSSPVSKNIEIITDRIFIPGEEKILRIKASDEILLASSEIDLSSTLRDYLEITPRKLSSEDFDENGIAEVRFSTDQPRIFKIVAKTDFGEVKSQSLLPQIFTDVPRNHQEVKAITYLKEQGIVRGYGDGTFGPDNNLTRAEAVKILMEANAMSGSKSTSFSDISANDWFAPYVSAAFENGILKGYPDGTFRPGKKISRAEFLKVALVSAGIQPKQGLSDPYPDVSADDWFYAYFQFSKEQRLMLPKKGGFIAPHQPITRSEAARIIWMLQT